jgi:hypothetical protein
MVYIDWVNKRMEILRSVGIEQVCVGYIERISVGNNECSSDSEVLVPAH